MDLYSTKERIYFSTPRNDIVELLPLNANARILEIGCGTGATGRAALAAGKAAADAHGRPVVFRSDRPIAICRHRRPSGRVAGCLECFG